MIPKNWPPDAMFEGHSRPIRPRLTRKQELLLRQKVCNGNRAVEEILAMVKPIAVRALRSCDLRPFGCEALLRPVEDGLRQAIEFEACNGQDTQGFGDLAVGVATRK